jgi:hypothetical protein
MIMSSVTVELAPDTERKLREQANRSGETLEAYLRRLAERAATAAPPPPMAGTEAEFPKFISRPQLTDEEFERNLKELTTGPPLPRLPADFSRADIYDDHD